jgi:oligopeptide transport system ATP-binding protein
VADKARPEMSTTTVATGATRNRQSGFLLEVEDLHTYFRLGRQTVRAVDGVSFRVGKGEAIGIVGESGCGKSVTALSLLRLLPRTTAYATSGRALFGGRDLLKASGKELQRIRGRYIGMVFQDPTTSLNPVLTIRRQMSEAIRWHLKVGAKESKERSRELLHQVGIADTKRVLSAYPHELSGGMKQRVMIGIALSCGPDLLLADEPTTALDVTIQAQILDLLREMAEKLGFAMVLITHDLGIIAGYTQRTYVMYAGKIVEEAPTPAIFRRPRHPYTFGLLESVPRLDRPRKDLLTPIEGTPPDPGAPRKGCAFAPRCRFAEPRSLEEEPPLEEVSSGHRVACWVKPCMQNSR